jgi:hypothetical protein
LEQPLAKRRTSGTTHPTSIAGLELTPEEWEAMAGFVAAITEAA